MVEKTLVEVTQIAAGDDAVAAGGNYDGPAVTLHWLTALLVVTLFALAEIWGFLPRGGTARHTLQWLHVSLGIALTVVVAIRMVWSGASGRRFPVPRQVHWNGGRAACITSSICYWSP